MYFFSGGKILCLLLENLDALCSSSCTSYFLVFSLLVENPQICVLKPVEIAAGGHWCGRQPAAAAIRPFYSNFDWLDYSITRTGLAPWPTMNLLPYQAY
jgi:hypothetical protein